MQLICAYQRLVSHYQAGFYREIARLWDQEQKEDPASSLEDSAWAVRTELGAALHLSNRSTDIAFNFALLLERASGVWQALSRGSIDHYRAEVLIKHTCHLPDPDLTWVVSRVIEEAEGLTASQIRVRVQRLCYLANPEDAALRYGEVVKNRMVEVRGNEFGTATLQGHDLPPNRAEAAYRHLKRLARKLKKKGDPRTIDQLMADLFLAQLLGEEENQKKTGGSVDLRVASKPWPVWPRPPGN